MEFGVNLFLLDLGSSACSFTALPTFVPTVTESKCVGMSDDCSALRGPPDGPATACFTVPKDGLRWSELESQESGSAAPFECHAQAAMQTLYWPRQKSLNRPLSPGRKSLHRKSFVRHKEESALVVLGAKYGKHL
eukprot:5176484-Amphidinium_carterae.2